MSLASDQITLASQGFAVEFTTGNYRLVRPGVDHAQVLGGDLGPVDGTAGLTTAVTKALGIVTNILADEAARRAIGTQQVFGAPLSWNPHTGGYV